MHFLIQCKYYELWFEIYLVCMCFYQEIMYFLNAMMFQVSQIQYSGWKSDIYLKEKFSIHYCY